MLGQTVKLVGTQRGGQFHKLSRYADDLLRFLSDPHTIAVTAINKFGQVSGYKLNLSKSVLLPVNINAQQLTFKDFPFEVRKDHFNYLGVCVTYNYKSLFNKNFTNAQEKVKKRC